MCLAIPGEIVELLDDRPELATVDVQGVRRAVNIGLLDDVRPGQWVLIHVGFAMSRIDEAEAHETLRVLEELGEVYEEELEDLRTSRIE